MRLVLLCALAAVATAAVAEPAVPPVTAPATLATLDVPADRGPQQVIVQSREFAPGSSSGWHTHPGVEISTVVAGTTEVRIGSAPPRVVRAGESVTIPRGAAHEARAIGSAPARLVITFVVDAGQPLRTVVPAPGP